MTTVDGRYVAVLLGVAIPLLVAYLTRPGAKRKRLTLALALPWLLCLFFPRSSIAVTWLTGSVLALGTGAVIFAIRTAARLPVSGPRRLAAAALVGLPSAYALIALTVVVGNNQLAVVPIRIAHQWPRIGAHERAVAIEGGDGYAIRGTYAPGDGDLGVLLVHGVSDGRDRWIGWARRLRAAGAHSLRIDQRAHGRSDGAVCTYGQEERHDVTAAGRWLMTRPGVERLVVVGTSMGGGTVLAASPNLDAEALVVLAPASDYADLVASRTALLGPFAGFVLAGSAWIARGMGQTPMTEWSPRAAMSGDVPVLVFHGEADETIPIGMSRALARARRSVTLVALDRVGHDEIPQAVAETRWDAVTSFVGL